MPSFEMTVNKSPGQAFEHTAIYCEEIFLWTMLTCYMPDIAIMWKSSLKNQIKGWF
jgi:hypothetical protein